MARLPDEIMAELVDFYFVNIHPWIPHDHLLNHRNTADQTKKSLTTTLLFIGWAAGNLIAPQIFQYSHAPRYVHGFMAHLVIHIVFIALTVLTRALLVRRNRFKERDVSHDLAFEDLTDRENPKS